MSNKPNRVSHPSDNPQENWRQSMSNSNRRVSTRIRTKTISIPSNRIGAVIGRNSVNINAIRRQCGAHINISYVSVMEGGRLIRRVDLTGYEDEIQQAEELIHRAMNQVSNDRGKEKVGEQKHKTKRTHLDTSIPSAFLQSDNPQENRTKSMSIQIGGVSTTTRMKTVDIPSDRVGVVTGNNEETINSIRRQSGATIRFHNISRMEGGRFINKVDLNGTEDEIHRAEELINLICRVIDEFIARGLYVARDATSVHHTEGVPRNQIHGTPKDSDSEGELDGQLSTGGPSRVSNDRGKEKVGDQERKSQDGMAAETKQTRLDSSQDIPCTSAAEHLGSAPQTSTQATDQPYDLDQSQFQSGAPHMPVPPLQGYTYNPTYQHAYGAQLAYGLQQGYAGSGGYYSSLASSYAPAVWPANATAPGGYPVHMNPYDPYYQSYSWPQVQPGTEAQASEPSQAGTGSQGHGSSQEYLNPTYQHAYGSQQGYAGSGGYYSSLASSYAPAVWPANATARGGYPVHMNPYDPYYQSYSWPQVQPGTEAQASEPSQAGTGSQGHGSSQEYMHPYASDNSQARSS